MRTNNSNRFHGNGRNFRGGRFSSSSDGLNFRDGRFNFRDERDMSDISDNRDMSATEIECQQRSAVAAIEKAADRDDFKEVLNLLQLAKNQKIVNVHIYLAVIEAMTGKQDKFQVAQDLISEAEKTIPAQSMGCLYTAFNKVAVSVGEYAIAQATRMKAIDTGIANSQTYAKYIEVAQDFEQALTAHLMAIENEKADSYTINAFLAAARKAGNFTELQAGFNAARQANLADQASYRIFIGAAGMQRKETAVREAYADARIKFSARLEHDTMKIFARALENCHATSITFFQPRATREAVVSQNRVAPPSPYHHCH